MNEHSSRTHIEITTGTIVKAILLVVCAWVLFILKDVVLVVLTAVVIASSAELPMKWFISRGISRVFSALIVYVVTIAILVGAFYTFVPQFLQDTSAFLSSVPKYLDSTSLWNPLGDTVTEQSKQVATDVSQGITNTQSAIQNSGGQFSIGGALQAIDGAMSNVSVGFIHSASSIFGGIVSFILIIVLSFYLAVQDEGIEKFLTIIVPEKHKGYIVGLWKRTQTKIGLWMQGQLILALLVGVLVYLGLMVLGIKNALLFAVLAALLETIPLFGPIIASIPAIASSYVDNGTSVALIVAGLYLIIHQFENHLIYPLVVKKIVGVPPILVILSLVVGFKLAGFLGIILSVPAASMIVEFIDEIEKRKKIANV